MRLTKKISYEGITFLLVLSILLITNITNCSSQQQKESFTIYNNPKVLTLDIIGENITEISSGAIVSQPMPNLNKDINKDKGFSFSSLKYIFGEIPSLSYKFTLVLLIWILLFFIILLIQKNIFRYSNWICIIISLIITIILSNLKLISLISNKITGYITSNIGKILLIIIIIFTIIIEVYLTTKKKNQDNK